MLGEPGQSGINTPVTDCKEDPHSFPSLLVGSFAGRWASNEVFGWDVGMGPVERGQAGHLPYSGFQVTQTLRVLFL